MAASALMERNFRLILVGGEFRSLSRTLVGPLTAKILDGMNISKAFLGTIGFDPEKGISTTDTNEAYTKELVMKRADHVFVLADSSKLGVSLFVFSRRHFRYRHPDLRSGDPAEYSEKAENPKYRSHILTNSRRTKWATT